VAAILAAPIVVGVRLMLKFLAGVVMGIWLTIKAQRTLRSWWN
jgi:hypothetical protein